MIKNIDFKIPKLKAMKEYPKELSYIGDTNLLNNKLISIVGTRRPSAYTKNMITQIASKLSNVGVSIVSGAAMGVDALAHKSAGEKNTIAILPNGLDFKYPAVNKKLISDIQDKGLCLSQFKNDFDATPWSFVVRNELVVALGDILIVGEADLKSGSMRSVEFALAQEKPIYVLPHRIGESQGTNKLLADGLAKAIYDIDEFVSQFGDIQKKNEDALLEFCKNGDVTYDEALFKFEDKVFEYELLGKISIVDGKVKVK